MMADELRLYTVCPTCGGSGKVPWGTAPEQPGEVDCPTCADAPGNPIGPKVYDGLRHIYTGRVQEIDDE